VLQNPEDEDRLVEEIDDQDLEDEGFEEEITEDITVPVLCESPSSLLQPQSPTSLAEVSMADVSLAEPSTSREGHQLAPSVLSQPSDTGSSLSDEAQVRHFKGFI